MNIGEANDFYALVDHWLGDSGRQSDARAALTRLADRANQALGAGPTGRQLADAWDARHAAEQASA